MSEEILEEKVKPVEKKKTKAELDKEKSIANDRAKALELAISAIEKQFGKGAIMKMTDRGAQNIEVISTGCLSIDTALGIGGLPRGRIIEIYGPESSGKTTLTLHVVAEAQRRGGTAAFIDAEHALDPVYASKLGVDIDNLYVSQPDSGEQALDITEKLVQSGAVDLIVIDSVAALTPRAEIDGEMGDSHIGLQARLMSQALRKLAAVINRTKTCVIFINQLREKVGITFGSPEVTPGGKALKFYASVRIDIRKGEPLKEGSEQVGNKTKVKIVKNKLAPPFRVAEVDILYGQGISREGDILELAIAHDLVFKSGSWFSYNDERLGQGKERIRELLKSKPEFCNELETKIKAAMAEKAE